MTELTWEKIKEMQRRFPPPPPDPFDSIFRPQSFAGLKVIVEQPVPQIQLSPDVADLVGPEFAADVNAWLIARFGFREPLAKVPLMFGSRVLVSPQDYSHIIRNVCS